MCKVVSKAKAKLNLLRHLLRKEVHAVTGEVRMGVRKIVGGDPQATFDLNWELWLQFTNSGNVQVFFWETAR